MLAVALSACVHATVTRSTKAKHAFVRQSPCPATGARVLPCSGYVIDHVVPLACGGADAPANMQWQTAGEARAKDRWERRECPARTKGLILAD